MYLATIFFMHVMDRAIVISDGIVKWGLDYNPVTTNYNPHYSPQVQAYTKVHTVRFQN